MSPLNAGAAMARDIIERAEEIPASDTWPDPDLMALKEGRRDAPALPTFVFGPYWDKWLSAAAEGANAPVDYPAMSLLASAAALIGNARWVSPWAGWKEPCILWCGNVGDPSSNKSPGVDPLLDLLRTLESGMAVNFNDTHRKWQTEREMARAVMDAWKGRVKEAVKAGDPAPQMPDGAVEPQEPIRPRIIVNDTTPEKLGELLSAHPKGLMFFRDELAAWFGGFDRYSGSGAERALWLEAFGGRKHVVDRVKSENPIVIPHLSISVLGGIQPERLAEVMEGPDDGLPARFLWTWPEKIAPRRPRLAADHGTAIAALRQLGGLQMGTDDFGNSEPRILLLSGEAEAAFQLWREEHHKGSASLTGAVASAWGKAPGQVLRIALVIEHLWWCSSSDLSAPPENISAVAINSAAGLVDDYFKPMALRVYGDAALPEKDRLAARVARWIVKTEKQPSVINARALRREVRLPGLKEADKVKLALDALADADWLRKAPARSGDNAGRTRDDYIVNPKLAKVTYGE